VPPLLPERRSQREREILAAARRCFVANGFHQTSMDDVIAAAGISAGGLYRYFPSKQALIAAVAAESVASLGDALSASVRDGAAVSVAGTVAAVLGVVDALADGPGRLGVQVWGEAQRDPQLAGLVATQLAVLRGHLAVVVERGRTTGRLRPDADVDALAAVTLAVVQGYLVQRLFAAPVSAQRIAAAVGALAGEDA